MLLSSIHSRNKVMRLDDLFESDLINELMNELRIMDC